MVAPVITDETLGFEAHQAIASWDKGTPSSSAIGFNPLTFFRTSSTKDLLARFCIKWFHKVGWEEKVNTGGINRVVMHQQMMTITVNRKTDHSRNQYSIYSKRVTKKIQLQYEICRG